MSASPPPLPGAAAAGMPPPLPRPPPRAGMSSRTKLVLAWIALGLVGLIAVLSWQVRLANLARAEMEAALARDEPTLALSLLEAAPLLARLDARGARLLRQRAWIAEAAARAERGDFVSARAALAEVPTARGAENWMSYQEAAKRIADAEIAALRADGAYEAVAALQLKAGDRKGAAESLQRAGNYDAAAALFFKIGQPRAAAEASAAAGDHRRAAEFFELAGDRPAAFRAWRQVAEAHALAGRNAEAAVLYQRIGDESNAASQWSAVGAAEAAAQRWEAAANAYQSAGDWIAAVTALDRGGRREAAVRLIQRQIDDPKLRARANLALDRKAEAASDYEEAGDIDSALALYKHLREWDSAASMLRRRGRLADAAEIYESAGQLVLALELWRSARLPDRVTGVLNKLVVEDLARNDFTTIRARISTVRSAEGRSALIGVVAKRCEPRTQGFDVAALFVENSDWRAAAPLFEKSGAALAAAEAWTRAGMTEESARVMVAAARSAGDPHLTMRAAERQQKATGRQPGELYDLACQQALAIHDYDAFVKAARGHLAFEEVSERLLVFAEQIADQEPYEAAAALGELGSYLVTIAMSPNTRNQLKRAGALKARIDPRIARFPKLVRDRSELTNHHDSDRSFLNSAGTIVIENNTGRLLSQVKLIVISTERAPDLFLGKETTLAVPSGFVPDFKRPASERKDFSWNWTSRAANDAFTTAPPAFRHVELVVDLRPGEIRPVTIAMKNPLPYRSWRVAFSE